MRLLYLPLGSQPGLEAAFRKVFKLEVFDYCDFKGNADEELVNRFGFFDPHIVHMQIQGVDKIKPETVMQLKHWARRSVWTQWSGDQRERPYQEMTAIGQVVDLTLINALGHIPMYERVGCKKVDYWQHGVDAVFNFPDCQTPWEYRQQGIVFCGNNYGDKAFPDGRKRRVLLERLTVEFPDFVAYGSGWEETGVRCHGRWSHYEQTELYHRCKITVGMGHFNDVELGLSDRPFIAMAAGTAHVQHYVPGMERYWKDGKHHMTFRTIDEAVEKIKWLLADEELRKAIGDAGMEVTRQYHTWDVRAHEYIELLKKHGLWPKQ